MSELADLFATDSPPPASSRGREALFFSPGSTPSHTPAKRRFQTGTDDLPSGSPSPTTRSRRARFSERGTPEPFVTTADGRRTSIDSVQRAAPTRDDGVLQVDLDTVAPRAVAELFDDPLAVQDPLALGGGEDHEPKRKRVIAKVDADRLLGPRGFPALASQAKRFKLRGKGHEVRIISDFVVANVKPRDLARLLEVYQMWAHTMFPKGEFLYTVGRVETLCRSRRMASGVSGLRDSFYPSCEVPDQAEDGHDNSLNYSGPDAESLGEFLDQDVETMRDETYRYAPGPETLGQSLFDTGRQDDDNEPDEDELLALHEAELGKLNGPGVTRQAQVSVDFGEEPPVFDEEDQW